MNVNQRPPKAPGKRWYSFLVAGTEPVCLLYFVNKLYNYSNLDEERRPWNDSVIVPALG